MEEKRSGPLGPITKALDVLQGTAMTIAILGLIIVVGAVSWQVCTRYLTSTPAPWAPEVAQIAFVWSALLAIAIGVRQQKHLVVDAFTTVKNVWLLRILNTVSTATIVIVSLALVWFGYTSLTVSFRRTFPALGIPTGWMHLAVPVAFACCAIFAVEVWLRNLRSPSAHHRLDDVIDAADLAPSTPGKEG